MNGMTKIASGRPKGLPGSTALLAGFSLLLLAGCETGLETGSSGSTAGAPVRAATASAQLERCSQPLGTAALLETNSDALGLLGSVGLDSPLPMLREMLAQSNCFLVVDRRTDQGRTTAQYVVTPNVVFAAEEEEAVAEDSDVLSKIGNFFAQSEGPMKVRQAQTNLFLNESRGGARAAASEGSAKVADFGGRDGVRDWGGGAFGADGLGGYGSDEGTLIAAAFVDAHNKLVEQVRVNRATVPPETRGERGNKALVTAIQRELKARGYYNASVDGLYGSRTRGAITQYQQKNDLPLDGEPSQNLLEHITGG